MKPAFFTGITSETHGPIMHALINLRETEIDQRRAPRRSIDKTSCYCLVAALDIRHIHPDISLDRDCISVTAHLPCCLPRPRNQSDLRRKNAQQTIVESFPGLWGTRDYLNTIGTHVLIWNTFGKYNRVKYLYLCIHYWMSLILCISMLGRRWKRLMRYAH